MAAEKKSEGAATKGSADSLAGQRAKDLWRSDLELVRRALEGDDVSRAQLVRRMVCIPRILSNLDRVRATPLGPTSLEDAAQAACTRILRDLPSFSGASKLETWFYGYAQNAYREEHRERLRSSGRERPLEALDGGPHREGGTDTRPAGERVAEREERQHLWAQMDQLDDELRRVLVLKLRDGLTFVQIAAHEGLETSGAKSRYYRAIELMRQRIGQAGPDLDRGGAHGRGTNGSTRNGHEPEEDLS